MAYSDFDLNKVEEELNIDIIDNQQLFHNINRIEISDITKQILKRNIPFALAINTEKAKSEFIISQLLPEVKYNVGGNCSFFSGIEFNVDKDKGLSGFCDFIISKSSRQTILKKPVIMLVEAKKDSIESGLGQCIAEMYAAQIFNQNDNQDTYGIITTGTDWKFLKLSNNIAYIDINMYYINDVEIIISIIIDIMRTNNR